MILIVLYVYYLSIDIIINGVATLWLTSRYHCMSLDSQKQDVGG